MLASCRLVTTEQDSRGQFEREFGEVIKRERARRGWSAEDAARRAGVAPKTWQRLEDGKPVRNKTFESVDGLFGLPPGTAVRVWQDGVAGVLEVALERAQRNEHVTNAARFAVGYRERRGPLTEAPDRDVLVEALGRLTPVADDPRAKAVLQALVPLAFAGIANDWDDLYDEDGNLLGAKGKQDGDAQH